MRPTDPDPELAIMCLCTRLSGHVWEVLNLDLLLLCQIASVEPASPASPAAVRPVNNSENSRLANFFDSDKDANATPELVEPPPGEDYYTAEVLLSESGRSRYTPMQLRPDLCCTML